MEFSNIYHLNEKLISHLGNISNFQSLQLTHTKIWDNSHFFWVQLILTYASVIFDVFSVTTPIFDNIFKETPVAKTLEGLEQLKSPMWVC